MEWFHCQMAMLQFVQNECEMGSSVDHVAVPMVTPIPFALAVVRVVLIGTGLVQSHAGVPSHHFY